MCLDGIEFELISGNNLREYSFVNSVDPDQLASDEVS